MEGLTLKDISIGLALIVGLLSSTAYLNKNLKDWIGKQFDDKVKPFQSTLDDLSEKVTRVDMQSCKNFLVRCLADFENGVNISETEQQRFWENYEHYISNGGNSYIKHKVEKLKSDGKL